MYSLTFILTVAVSNGQYRLGKNEPRFAQLPLQQIFIAGASRNTPGSFHQVAVWTHGLHCFLTPQVAVPGNVLVCWQIKIYVHTFGEQMAAKGLITVDDL